jgi:two-component system KDP operon response regulator KdpE
VTRLGEAPRSPSASRATDASILVVDDEPALLRALALTLEAEGYRVATASDGRSALDAASEQEPDVVVLDLGLPDLDGIEVCRHLRRWSSVPLIVLTADGAEDRKVTALDQGADDYLTKPFSLPELLARVRVALRHRRQLAGVVDDDRIDVGDTTVDIAAHVASAGGVPIELTRKEFALLAVLARNRGRLLTYGRLLEVVWGLPPTSDTQPLRTHVSLLRKKLGEGRLRPRIENEPGVGYRLVVPG